MQLTTALLLVLTISQTASDDIYQTHVKDGLRLYKEGDFAAAAIEFEDAYLLKQEPSLVYNAARCYEKIPRIEEAIAKYRQYLALSGTTAEQRAKARATVAALETEKTELARGAVPTPVEPPPPVVPPPPPPRSELIATAPAPAPGRSYVLETGLFAVGAAGIITGVVFGVLANGSAHDYQKAVSESDRDAAGDSARSNALIADISFGVGIGAIVTAGILLLVDGNDDEVE